MYWPVGATTIKQMATGLTSPTGQHFPPTAAASRIVQEMQRRKDATSPSSMPLPQSPESAARSLARQLNFGTDNGQERTVKAATEKSPRTEPTGLGHQDNAQHNQGHGHRQQQNTDKNAARNGQTWTRAGVMDVPSFLHPASGDTDELTLDSIIDTVIGGYELPARLVAKRIASFYDRYENTLKTHEDLRDTVGTSSQSEQLRKELADFFRGFMTRNKCDTKQETWDMAAVATLHRITSRSIAARLEVAKSLLYGAGLSSSELQDAAMRVKNRQEMGDRTASSADTQTVDFVGVLGLAIERVCKCASDVDQADDTVHSLTVLDLEDCDRITDALAVERVQWEQCVRELGEKPFANYLRITNFKRNLLQRFGEVVVEFDFIIAHRSELNLTRIKDWRDAEKLFVEAAVVAARNNHQDSRYDASTSDAGSESSGDNRRERRHGPPAIHAIAAGLPPKPGPTPEYIADMVKKLETTGESIHLNCSICKKEFGHSVEKQIEFAERGWWNTPRKCPACTEEQNKSKVCFDFRSGNCKYGDLCRFSHNESEGRQGKQAKPVVNHIASEESSDSEEYGDY